MFTNPKKILVTSKASDISRRRATDDRKQSKPSPDTQSLKPAPGTISKPYITPILKPNQNLYPPNPPIVCGNYHAKGVDFSNRESNQTHIQSNSQSTQQSEPPNTEHGDQDLGKPASKADVNPIDKQPSTIDGAANPKPDPYPDFEIPQPTSQYTSYPAADPSLPSNYYYNAEYNHERAHMLDPYAYTLGYAAHASMAAATAAPPYTQTYAFPWRPGYDFGPESLNVAHGGVGNYNDVDDWLAAYDASPTAAAASRANASTTTTTNANVNALANAATPTPSQPKPKPKPARKPHARRARTSKATKAKMARRRTISPSDSGATAAATKTGKPGREEPGVDKGHEWLRARKLGRQAERSSGGVETGDWIFVDEDEKAERECDAEVKGFEREESALRWRWFGE
ncbi:uncharacterized protein K452DRAFT_37577 [Aplosporella prunicola CBS 121167]|uniref:Uncharacterized protein n=1 Tax=Aplosporella prunicola CBS 121167 TaxID=1176127 RepID=A0A6A6BAK6_9PEZI|nr:uncharacterized protein K452DRAFT_37577 [Aplosporella prunicola CBS 121167]KAF2141282.1 hypothetical protein K452DRAFT_37577 [Aplosporella prunicola CBS 121167]